ncbi:MAG: 4Fe-4S dicluster domain-containing protein [Rhodocyclaceae bacterium]|nr:4Fe-4S dicluster domain-containing protein [Rhodocyclaceae bacterium]
MSDDQDSGAPDGSAEATPRAAAGGVKPPMSSVRAQQARRRFIRTVGLGTVVVGAGLAGYLPVAAHADQPRLRPPGALDEDDFLASCIKCGQCVQVCPVEAIVLGDITDGFGLGVPHIESRDQACDFSCDAVQCILACPTGALVYRKPDFLAIRDGAELAHKPVLKAKAKDPEPTLNLIERSGLARLSRPDACLATQGKGFSGPARGTDFTGQMRYMDVDRWKPVPVADHPYERELCDLCVTECPIADAIRLEVSEAADGSKRGIPVVMEQCVGCGVCEMICPVEPTAIVIDSRAVWEGEA